MPPAGANMVLREIMCSRLLPEKDNLIVVDLDLEFQVGIDQV